uniref:Uncharacterized protein n=1 Tax=Palpitomonas bilix TaxID=652834 RepID=A0A7S3D1W1_9EUKA|mmetsp:Transcript_1874/g.3963  ORF Transcript_1874/g.3963 Transcript_1874/m.3963 type:complete len:299 (+) Transcript_1874:209-1105(+)
MDSISAEAREQVGEGVDIERFVRIFLSACRTRSLQLQNLGLHDLPPALRFLRPTRLDLSYNDFSTLPSLLFNAFSHSLTSLTVVGNSIEELPQQLSFCVRIQRLVLRSNRLRTLPTFIASLPLIELDVFNNELSIFPMQLERVKSLRILNVGRNHLSAPLPSLRSFPNLERAVFCSNKISTLVGFFSSEGFNVQYLDVSGNRLTSISSEIKGGKKLEELLLRNNALKTVPIEVVRLPSLRVLSLFGNPLEGPFGRVASSMEKTMSFLSVLREELKREAIVQKRHAGSALPHKVDNDFE